MCYEPSTTASPKRNSGLDREYPPLTSVVRNMNSGKHLSQSIIAYLWLARPRPRPRPRDKRRRDKTIQAKRGRKQVSCPTKCLPMTDDVAIITDGTAVVCISMKTDPNARRRPPLQNMNFSSNASVPKYQSCCSIQGPLRSISRLRTNAPKASPHNFFAGLAEAIDAVNGTGVGRLPVVHHAPLIWPRSKRCDTMYCM